MVALPPHTLRLFFFFLMNGKNGSRWSFLPLSHGHFCSPPSGLHHKKKFLRSFFNFFYEYSMNIWSLWGKDPDRMCSSSQFLQSPKFQTLSSAFTWHSSGCQFSQLHSFYWCPAMLVSSKSMLMFSLSLQEMMAGTAVCSARSTVSWVPYKS